MHKKIFLAGLKNVSKIRMLPTTAQIDCILNEVKAIYLHDWSKLILSPEDSNQILLQLSPEDLRPTPPDLYLSLHRSVFQLNYSF